MADTVVQELVINTLTQAQFDAAKEAGTLSPYELYGTPDTSADRDLMNTTDNVDIVIESQLPTSANGYTWYRKYKSGWVEQGGSIRVGEITSGTQNITLPIEMSDNQYWCMLSCVGREGNTGAYSGVTKSSNSTPTTLVLQLYLTGAHDVYWQVSGMSAQ